LAKIATQYSVSNITQIPVVWSTGIASMFINEINTVDFAARYTAIRNDRRQRARFTCSYTQITSGLLYNINSDPASLDAAGVKFCSYPGTAFNAEITANFPLATLITTYANSDAAFAAVVSGECNATVNDKYALGALTQANPGAVILATTYMGTTSDFIGFIVGADNCSSCTGMIPETGNAALRLAMNAAQLAITSGEYNTIAAKYGVTPGFSSDCSANAASFNLNTYPTASGVLSDVIAKREVVVATGDAFLPYYTYTNGTLSGFMTEYTQLVFNKIATAYSVPSIAVKFVLESDSSFNFLAKLAVNGSFSTSQRQIYLTTAQDARNQAVTGGCSVYNVQAAVMTTNGVTDPTASGLIFAVWTASTYATLTTTAFPNAVIVSYPSTEDALAAVLSGAANATVNDKNYLASYILANNASSMLTIGQDVGTPSAVSYQFRYDTCPVCRNTVTPVSTSPVAVSAPTATTTAPKAASASQLQIPALVAALFLIAALLL
jgi:ABC-type amino acid transport substrate-binding protein